MAKHSGNVPSGERILELLAALLAQQYGVSLRYTIIDEDTGIITHHSTEETLNLLARREKERKS